MRDARMDLDTYPGTHVSRQMYPYIKWLLWVAEDQGKKADPRP